ncbi:MAG: hypothetical protein KGO81_07370 [Bacteroidota bacterium]|nr:hypothetical protein [Bacteroidota bacterium]
MKKVFALLAIAGFVACNSGENKTATTDSAATAAPAAVDTTKKDTAAPAAVDTTKKDTTKKM